MGIFTKDRDPKRATTSAAAKRAAMLATSELVPWAETCLYQIGRSLTDYTKDQDPYALAEATVASDALQVIITEINERLGEPGVEVPGLLG